MLTSCAPKDLPQKVAKKATVMDADILESRGDASDTILEKADGDFLGHHPVEESFLFWVDENYGGNVLSGIVSNGDYTNPDIWYELTGETIHVLWARYEKLTGIGIYHMERIIWQEDQKEEDSDESETVLDFTGDFTLADDVATTIRLDEQPGKLKDCFSEELVDEMQSADLFVINNEFAYTSRGAALWDKDYTFRSDPARVNYLADIGVDVASLANNHVFDYGEEGLSDTLTTLHDAGYKTVGAGENLDEAADPLYYIAGGRKIAIVAATQVERSVPLYTREATDTESGVLKTLHPERYIQEIEEANKNADIVICIAHWGTEGNVLYGADQAELAEAFVEAGADVIVGSHTHCLQGIEYIGEVPVYYSLGNYFFSLADWMPQGYDTGLAKIHIAEDGAITGEFVPCRFDEGVTRELTDSAEVESLYSYIESISETTTITEEGIIEHR